MDDWSERILGSTRGRIIQHLRRGEATVKDLAAAVDLTGNAVRAQLAVLEADGLVQQAGTRPGKRRPEALYALTEEARRLFPQAYGLLLDVLLDILARRLPPDELEDVLRATGARIGAARSAHEEEDLAGRVQRAARFLGEIGGLAEVDRTDGGFRIRGFSCPLAAVVEHHPEVCVLAETLLAELIGVPVRQRCLHDGPPRCRFHVG